MFDFYKRYSDALDRAQFFMQEYNRVTARLNALIDIINAKGGEDFLLMEVESQFSADELTKLINLCHPDKHDGKPMAVEMTQKLLQLKERLKQVS